MPAQPLSHPADSTVIRLAMAHDMAAVVSCARQAYAQYVERMGKEPAPMRADYALLIKQGRIHVATKDRAVFGYIVLFRRGEELHIENIAVRPEACGRGIGRRLMQFAEDHARQQGLPSINLYTNEAMVETLAWYPRLGYEEFERREDEGFRRVYFRKLLLPIDAAATQRPS